MQKRYYDYTNLKGLSSTAFKGKSTMPDMTVDLIVVGSYVTETLKTEPIRDELRMWSWISSDYKRHESESSLVPVAKDLAHGWAIHITKGQMVIQCAPGTKLPQSVLAIVGHTAMYGMRIMHPEGCTPAHDPLEGDCYNLL